MAQAEWNAPTHVMTGESVDGKRRPDRPHADAMLSASLPDSPPASDPTPIHPSDTEEVQEISTNPQVAALQLIFPDFDPIILCVEARVFSASFTKLIGPIQANPFSTPSMEIRTRRLTNYSG